MRRWAGLLLAMALVTSAPPASAQDTDAAMAESLFLEARRLMEEGQLEAACAKLQASQDLDPQLGTLLNLGNCLEKVGRTASAWAAFTELARLAARAGQSKRADYASERVAVLAPSLSYLTLSVTAPVPNQRVTVDGRVIADAAYGTALPLDPGEREVRAEAEGYEPWSARVTVEPGTRRSLAIPSLVR
ncbi:MAG: PEGA domain-containing protein, partial [Myxococcales bacterium]|nr:PEGA domain-containing protein [Myxococcales bacterium]